MESVHSFHIPVMGLAFTIDSPVKVARFGIASTISIVEDRLLETMRRHYYPAINERYVPITAAETDYRAKRITDYLNLLNRIVNSQLEKLRASAFEAGSEIVQYFEMLPPDSSLKQLYRRMQENRSWAEKAALQQYLRSQIKAGSIDVNIMTKVDRDQHDEQGNLIEEGSDALTALRGYAQSELRNSSVVFSAGMNPRLFSYLEKLSAFEATDVGAFAKKVVIKVSDFRSALIQGKYLAKKGIWVSEFRIESGLNCGGHAFATDGLLLGPILEEFKTRREELQKSLHEHYAAALLAKGKAALAKPHPIRLSVQGGIGTAAEDEFLRNYFGVHSTGWGTPFLLCPEATTVDAPTRSLLSQAGEADVVLSRNSPLGVRFHYLKGTSSEAEKLSRIATGKPGSPCTEKHLASNTEFTAEPICTASRKYQALKLAQLQSLGLAEEDLQKQSREVLAKECLCVGLSNSVSHVYGVPFLKKLPSVTICPGPNIRYFSKIVSLPEMVGHIYGREDLLAGVERPHMFLNELKLYVDYLEEQLQGGTLDARQQKYCEKFSENLLSGIAYYHSIADKIGGGAAFSNALEKAALQIKALFQLESA